MQRRRKLHPGMNTSVSTPLDWTAFQALDEAAFCAHLGSVVEHSPWVAQRAWAAAPFADWHALFDAMAQAIRCADEARQLALLRAHPELAGQEARAGTMTADSQSEQGRLGLLELDAGTVRRIEQLNQRYQQRFGHPFIVALRLHASLDTVLQAFETRLAHDDRTERQAALQQICEVMRGRLAQAVSPEAASPSLAPPSVTTLAGSPS